MNDKPRIRLMIVDDHAIVREGIQVLLERYPDLEVVAAASGGAEALAVAERMSLDLVLLDLRMPQMDGLETMDRLRARHPGLKVVILSGQEGDELIHQALSRGALGYLMKTSGGADLAEGIRQAVRGRLPTAPAVAAQLAARSFYSPLSEREIEVLRLAGRGRSNKEIGVVLDLAENTVKNHMKSIIEKLQAADRTESVTIALRRGIITLDD